MKEPLDIRWQQRFRNFSRAFSLLSEVVETEEDITKLEPIVKEGIIQRFEYTFELGWKTLKDLMEADGLEFERTSPKYVFKLGFQSKYLEETDVWLKMSGDRNAMSHTYDFEKLDEVLMSLRKSYFPAIRDLHGMLELRLISQ